MPASMKVGLSAAAEQETGYLFILETANPS